LALPEKNRVLEIVNLALAITTTFKLIESNRNDSLTTLNHEVASVLDLFQEDTNDVACVEKIRLAAFVAEVTNATKIALEMSKSNLDEVTRNAEHEKDDALQRCEYDKEMALAYSTSNTEAALVQKAKEIGVITANADQTLTIEVHQMRSILGCVAHDLKTPLQSFMSDLESLKVVVSSLVDRPSCCCCCFYVKDADEIFESLDTSVKFMMMQINRSQDYMKGSNNLALTPTLSTFSLGFAISQALKCMARLYTGRHIVFHPLAPAINDNMVSDEHWIIENALCLLSNAVKYSIRGSTVDVKVNFHNQLPIGDAFCLKGQQFGFNQEVKGDYISISVEDSGVGISAELLANLFEPFNKV
jgi:signal transduction histidine kinase